MNFPCFFLQYYAVMPVGQVLTQWLLICLCAKNSSPQFASYYSSFLTVVFECIAQQRNNLSEFQTCLQKTLKHFIRGLLFYWKAHKYNFQYSFILSSIVRIAFERSPIERLYIVRDTRHLISTSAADISCVQFISVLSQVILVIYYGVIPIL